MMALDVQLASFSCNRNILHHVDMLIEFGPPQTPLLYGKSGVYRPGIPQCSYFC